MLTIGIRRILSGPIRNPSDHWFDSGRCRLLVGSEVADIIHEPLELARPGCCTHACSLHSGYHWPLSVLWEAQGVPTEIAMAAIIKLTRHAAHCVAVSGFLCSALDDTRAVYGCDSCRTTECSECVQLLTAVPRVATPLARDSVVLTTLVSLPIMIGLGFAVSRRSRRPSGDRSRLLIPNSTTTGT
jgi:hypothetical protein